MKSFARFFALLILPISTFASSESASPLDLTHHWVGYAAIAIFTIAYVFVVLEEKLHLRKSKPILLAAGLIWIIIAIAYKSHELPHLLEDAIRHDFLEYAELFFFLLVAMTYINAMLERGVFTALRNWLVTKGFDYWALFWITGVMAFCLSPIIDNLTTAFILSAVVLAVGDGQPKFVAVACVNIVVAANAGGAFSPFGDITTLMVWQKGVIEFWEFFDLLIPSIVNFLVPALIMQFAIPSGKPEKEEASENALKHGGLVIVILFLLTIATAVTFHNVLHIPPVFGMMMGLSYLKFFGFYLRRKSRTWAQSSERPPETTNDPFDFDVFKEIAHAEWDTLFFFYGVILAVGGLGFIGYLSLASGFIYGELGPTTANILVGLMSAIVDNIPVMFAVLTMNPDMPQSQWLLVTLTAGVGGSLLSIGSAAGVALMGQARGQYTFFTHLKWTPVIGLGYAASIWVHLIMSG